MALPLDLAQVVLAGIRPIYDSFESWPNGTVDAIPGGWFPADGDLSGSGAETFTQSDRSTLNVTDGAYSWLMRCDGTGPPSQVSFKRYRYVDLTGLKTIKLDIEYTHNYGSIALDLQEADGTPIAQIEYIDDVSGTFNLNIDIATATGAPRTGLHRLQIRMLCAGPEEDTAYFDNLRIEP